MYAPSLVSNSRDEMSRLFTGVFDVVKEECCTVMLLNDIDISRLMVFAQQIEASKTMDIRKVGNSRTSNDSSKKSTYKMFYHRDYSKQNKDRSQKP